MKNYRPLPSYLTIRKSKIEGLGLFAHRKIPHDKLLGTTHWKIVLGIEGEANLLRTPLGGFINHNNKPNVQLIVVGNVIRLTTLKFIEKGDELFTKYQLYDIYNRMEE